MFGRLRMQLAKRPDRTPVDHHLSRATGVVPRLLCALKFGLSPTAEGLQPRLNDAFGVKEVVRPRALPDPLWHLTKPETRPLHALLRLLGQGQPVWNIHARNLKDARTGVSVREVVRGHLGETRQQMGPQDRAVIRHRPCQWDGAP